MGFITAMFLSYLTEEDAFFLLLSIMNFPPHSLTGLYSPGLPKVRVLEYQLQVRPRRHCCCSPASRVVLGRRVQCNLLWAVPDWAVAKPSRRTSHTAVCICS